MFQDHVTERFLLFVTTSRYRLGDFQDCCFEMTVNMNYLLPRFHSEVQKLTAIIPLQISPLFITSYHKGTHNSSLVKSILWSLKSIAAKLQNVQSAKTLLTISWHLNFIEVTRSFCHYFVT